MDQLNSLFLFHFDSTLRAVLEKKLNLIEQVAVTSPVTMKFAHSKQKVMSWRLKTHLAWMQKWQTTFEPSKHCKIEKLDSNYKLSCDIPDARVKKDPWVQIISNVEVHIQKLNI